MMDDFASAVAVTLSTHADQHSRQQALDYIQSVESSPQGWQPCLAWFVAADLADEASHLTAATQFACLKVVEMAIKREIVTESERVNVRNGLTSWMERSAANGRQPPAFVQNKAAQLLVMLICIDYPARWPSAFSQLAGFATQGSSVATLLVLRVLYSVAEDVVEAGHGSRLKDSIRTRDVSNLVTVWRQGLVPDHDAEVHCMCLKTLSHFMDWMDVGIFITSGIVESIFQALTAAESQIACAACEALAALGHKGMPLKDKLRLLSHIGLWERLSGRAAQAQADDDVDTLIAIGQAVAAAGTDVCDGIMSSMSSASAQSGGGALPLPQQTEETVTGMVDLMIRLLGHEDDGVSETVHTLATQCVMLLKQGGDTSSLSFLWNHMEPLMETCVEKMVYDADFTFDDDTDDHAAAFSVFRRDLSNLLKHLCHLAPAMTASLCRRLTLQKLSRAAHREMTWMQLELAVHVVYLLAEYLPSSLTRSASAVAVSARSTALSAEQVDHVLVQFLEAIVASNVIQHGHRAVCLAVLEVFARCTKYLVDRHDLLDATLQAFLGETGCRHPTEAVRARACYLFGMGLCRDKRLRPRLAELLRPILNEVQPMMTLAAVQSSMVSMDTQLYLVEGVGWLSAHWATSDDKSAKESARDLVVGFITDQVQTFQYLYPGQLTGGADVATQQYIAQLIAHTMNSVVRVSKGISDRRTADQFGCTGAFRDALWCFVDVLGTNLQKQTLHASFRMFLHRMIVVLGDEVLPCLPNAVSGLLREPEPEGLSDFVLLVHHLITKFGDVVGPFLDSVFLPFVQTIFGFLSREIAPNDMEARQEQATLRRAYFNLLYAVTAHGLSDILISATNGPHLGDVLSSIVEGGCACDDPRIQKQAFATLAHLLKTWLSQDGTWRDQQLQTFFLQRVLHTAVQAPLRPIFDLADAQWCLALGEIGALLLLLYTRAGPQSVAAALSTAGFADDAVGVLCDKFNQADGMTAAKAKTRLSKELRQAFGDAKRQSR